MNVEISYMSTLVWTKRG